MSWVHVILISLLVLWAYTIFLRIRKGKTMTVVYSLLLMIVGGYILFGFALFLLQSRFLYYPIKTVDYTPDTLGMKYEPVMLTTEDGVKLSAWFLPVENSKYTVLFCHGNAGNISHRFDSLEVFAELGLSCLIFDYRGYGDSQGTLSEEGTYLDAKAAWQWLVKEKDIDPANIIIFGRSLGGSIAANLASNVKPAGLVTESAFTSFVAMGRSMYPFMPVGLFARYKYNTADYISKISCPVMIIHSTEDELVPFKFGEKLFQLAHEPKKFVKIEGGHNDGFMVSGPIYKDAWRQWLGILDGSDQSDPQIGD